MLNSDLYDTIVIGGGLMGSSAAWHLSNAGEQVLLIEKQTEKYHQGSSFGEARITRSLGPKKDIFSWLHNRAVAETKKLATFLHENQSSGRSLMNEIYTTSPVTYIYYHAQKETTDGLIAEQDDPIEVALNPEEAFSKFGMSVSDDAIVIREFKEFSGTLNPEILIEQLHRAIRLQGNTIWFSQRTNNITLKNGLFELSLEDAGTGKKIILSAKKVITAAGPYTGKLLKSLSPAIAKQITPKRVCLAFFSITEETWNRLSPEQQSKAANFFPLIDMNPDFIFSMIESWDDYGVPVIKIGGHLRRESIKNLDPVWEKGLSTEEIEWACSNISGYFRKLNIPIGRDHLLLTGGYSCVYSMTDSEIPLVTEAYDANNCIIPGLVVMGGMSGVGAKGSMAYGLIAKNLLLNKSETDQMYRKTVHALSINRYSH